MKKFLFLLISVSVIFTACQSDKSEEKSVEEIQQNISKKTVGAKGKLADKNKPQEPKDTVNVGAFAFDDKVFEFGTVNEGEKVNHTYKFKNTGKVPLIISNARGSCGCTVPDWSKEPIPVGGEGEIRVVFNTNGKKNAQTKNVTLTANTYPVSTIVSLKGFVTPKPVDPTKAKDKAKTKVKTKGNHDGHNH